uniref:Uncharacterized protein n=1 Tax=Eutreptiella gymnastica TaxID=73025 RepID=A0A7S4FV24_9EUGL
MLNIGRHCLGGACSSSDLPSLCQVWNHDVVHDGDVGANARPYTDAASSVFPRPPHPTQPWNDHTDRGMTALPLTLDLLRVLSMDTRWNCGHEFEKMLLVPPQRPRTPTGVAVSAAFPGIRIS